MCLSIVQEQFSKSNFRKSESPPQESGEGRYTNGKKERPKLKIQKKPTNQSMTVSHMTVISINDHMSISTTLIDPEK